MDEDFYRSFHIIVCGLDSIVARRWLNGMVMSLVTFNDDGTPDEETFIPIVDGGTEGFKGNARVIIPTMTPCIECTLDLYPPQVIFNTGFSQLVLLFKVTQHSTILLLGKLPVMYNCTNSSTSRTLY